MSEKKGNILVIILLLVLIIGIVGYDYSKGLLSHSLVKYGTTPSRATGSNSATNPAASATNQEIGDVTSRNLPLTVISPANGATLSSTLLTLTGKTVPNADVFVNDQTTKADVNGNFSVKLTLDEGQNEIVVNANDANGNVVEVDLLVNVKTS